MRAIRDTIRATIWGLAALVTLALPVPGASGASGDDAPQEPLTGSLTGKFLVAAPDMADPRFDHAVILVVQHDRGGAFGLIVNQPVEEEPLAKLLDELGAKSDGVTGKIEIYAGGPVATEIGFVLHSAEYRRPETMVIDGKVAITSSPGVLRDIALQHGPLKYLVAFGCAGWGAGQLESELQQRVWFIAPGDAQQLFDDDRTKLWQDVFDRREQAL